MATFTIGTDIATTDSTRPRFGWLRVTMSSATSRTQNPTVTPISADCDGAVRVVTAE